MRETIQDREDGPLSADDLRALESHLAECEECRAYRRGIAAVREALRSMPLHRFPEADVQEVLDRTVRAGAARRRGWLDWRPLAAAATLAASLLGIWLFGGSTTDDRQPGYSAREVAQATAELRLVLGYTARTVRRAEEAAVAGVLANEVSPALERIPLLGGSPARYRRSGT